MQTATHFYTHDTLTCEGYMAAPDDSTQRRPAVLIAHDWSGRNAFACEQADRMAQLGYVGFAMDNYGNGSTSADTAEKMAFMQPLVNDRSLLQARLIAAFNAVRSLPQVDATRIGIVGFCFGGLCALDLARSGVALTCAVSFHGLLHAPTQASSSAIQTKILVMHGWDDPMVPPAELETFGREMTQREADWQLHAYSQTQHAFMVPSANDAQLGTLYQPRSAKRAQRLMIDFLNEQLLSPPPT